MYLTTTPLNSFPLPSDFPSTETLYYPPTSISPSAPPMLLFFLPGNPGVIHYYTPFLSTVSSLLNSSANNIHILGVSHAGFDTRPEGDKRRYGLQEQIDGKVELLEWIAQQWGEGKLFGWRKGDSRRLRVMVMGHSVGGFIALEAVKRIGDKRKEGLAKGEVEITGGVLLFPAIVDIALSPRGRMLSPFFRSPFLCAAVSTFATLLAILFPRWLLSHLIRLTTNFPPQAVESTLKMLECGNAVAEAFYMAREEMDEITSDGWGADIWGTAEEVGNTSKDGKGLEWLFYFGKDDYWMANSTRDELIRLRGRSNEKDKWKPRMIVCEDGLPHGFAIAHSERVAEKVFRWVMEMVVE